MLNWEMIGSCALFSGAYVLVVGDVIILRLVIMKGMSYMKVPVKIITATKQIALLASVVFCLLAIDKFGGFVLPGGRIYIGNIDDLGMFCLMTLISIAMLWWALRQDEPSKPVFDIYERSRLLDDYDLLLGKEEEKDEDSNDGYLPF